MLRCGKNKKINQTSVSWSVITASSNSREWSCFGLNGTELIYTHLTVQCQFAMYTSQFISQRFISKKPRERKQDLCLSQWYLNTFWLHAKKNCRNKSKNNCKHHWNDDNDDDDDSLFACRISNPSINFGGYYQMVLKKMSDKYQFTYCSEWSCN